MSFKMLALATASLLAVAVPPAANAAKPVYGDWGYDQSAMDSSVKPGDDFWAYVNGTWDKTHPDRRRPRFGRPVRHPLRRCGARRSADRRSSSPSDPNRDHLGQQIGDYYASFMDRGAIEAAGHRAAEALSCRDRRAKTRAQLLSLFVKPGFRKPGRRRHRANFKNPDVYAVFAGQATLGMPSREYYLEDNAKMKAHRAAYRDYIVTIEKLAGLPGGEAAADRIIALETELSKAQWTAADRRDIDKIYNPMTRAQLIEARAAVRLERVACQGGPWQSPKTVIVTRAFGGRRRGQDPRLDAALDLEGMARVPLRLGSRERSAQGVRRCALRLLFEGAVGRSAAARALEARCCGGQRRARRGRRPDLRQDAFPGRSRAADERADRQPSRTPIASASAATAGWTRRPARPRSRSSPRSSRASATR